MTFTLLPAVDVAGGRAVRLARGDVETETVDGDPREVAFALQAEGATWIHLVDLDAAFGRGSNAALLADMVGELDVEVQLSGGIHDDATLGRALSTGCARLNIGTAALADPDWCAQAIATHGERLAVSLDVRITDDANGASQHRLVARGGGADVGELWEMLERLDRASCSRYVVTDVSRDGMLSGPNVALYDAVTGATSASVIVSGGISSIDDLVVLAERATEAPAGSNLDGSIVGKALSAGRFTLTEALAAVRRTEGAAR